MIPYLISLPRKRPSRAMSIGLMGLLAILLLAGGCSKPVSQGDTGRAPDFSLPSLDGKTISLAELRGKVVLVNFWTTWCPACIEEMPLLQAAHEDKASSGLVVLGVDMREDRNTVASFVEENGITFPIVLDGDGKVSSMYNVYYIPHTVLIDAEGNVNRVKVGPFISTDEILSAVEPLLARSAAP